MMRVCRLLERLLAGLAGLFEVTPEQIERARCARWGSGPDPVRPDRFEA